MKSRTWLLVSAFACLVAGEGAILALAPSKWFLHALPVLAWGGLFLAWAWRKLKDPHYYDDKG